MTPLGSAAPQPLTGASAGAVCVVLHDVTPARWAGCTQVLRDVRAVARTAGVALPVTLLVVPCWHGDSALPPHYRRWLLNLQERDGHELALHGFTHQDDGPPPRGLRERLQRRRRNAREAEFAALGYGSAMLKLAAARDWAQLHGFGVPRGFVAPAGRIGPDALDAVAAAGFAWTATPARLIALPDGAAWRTPALAFGGGPPWRRAAARLWSRAVASQARQAPLLRVDLHPQDSDDPATRRCWMGLLAVALRTREPLSMDDAVQRARVRGTPPASARA